MSKHLVLIGGGHAHMQVMRRLEKISKRGHRVTLVSPDSYHYYSGMGPGMLGGIYRVSEARFNVGKMVSERGGKFLHGRVVRIDSQQKELTLASGKVLAYDVASCNVGSVVSIKQSFIEGPKLIPVKPVVNLAQIRERLLAIPRDRSLNLAVVGGGPAGCEVAGNMRRLLDDNDRCGTIEIFTSKKILKNFPDQVRRWVLNNFSARDIDVTEDAPVGGEAGSLFFENGIERAFDLVVMATGVRPPSLFADSALPVTPDGGLKVNSFLQVTEAPDLFGGGDCISFDDLALPKIGVHAVRQNPILLHNLSAALEGEALMTYKPQANALLIINAGNGLGVANWQKWVVGGHSAFCLKDWLDRRFMRRFQMSGEREEVCR